MNPYIGMMICDYIAGEEYRIEGIGFDWIVGRDEIGKPVFYSFDTNQEMLGYIEDCRKAKE